MAGIGAEAVTPLNVNPTAFLAQAVAPSEAIVNPNAVAQMTDAFRKGQISADDIIARYGDVAKAKDKAEIQGLSEFISPEAIQARKSSAELMGEKAKSELALLPAGQAAQEAEYQAKKIAAQQGDRKAMRDVAIKLGFGGQLSPPGQEYTPENAANDAKAYQTAIRYENAIKGASDIEKDVDRKEYQVTKADGSVIIDPSKDALRSKTSAINYTPEQAVRAKRLANMTPEQFIAAGSPTVDDYVFGGSKAEGGAAGGDNKNVTPVNKLVTPEIVETTETTAPDGTKTVKTRTIKSTTHPNPDAAAVEQMGPPAPPEKPAFDINGERVLKEAPVKPETTKEVEDAATRIMTAQDMIDKSAEALGNIESSPGIVGPGAFEGTGFGQALAEGGAFVGIPGARAKFDKQNQLNIFLAGSIQNTIRSLAGSGNRVMQAEIADKTGLFNKAQPQLKSTPEEWKRWLSHSQKVFRLAKDWEEGRLPKEELDRINKLLGPGSASPTAAAATPSPAAATPKIVDMPGIGRGYLDPATGKFHLVGQ